MGAFGIFAAILTFVYVIYYAVTIGMDAMGDKGKKKSDVEVFAIEGSPGEGYQEQPTFVTEDGEPQTGLSEGQSPSEAYQRTASPSEEEESGEEMASRIKDADEEELYAKAKEAEGEMTKVVAESQDEVSSATFEQRLMLLVSEIDSNAERMSL